jgi:RNA polymerase sigma-70 factor (ECF subfamily)
MPGSAGVGTLTAEDASKLDPALVAALFLEHEEELRRFLVGVLRDRQLASDALQTTFAKMIEHGHEVREASRKAWLFRVAFNEAMLLRRREATGDRVIRRAAWSRPQEQAGSDEPLIRLEEVELVRSALAELPVEQQRVVRMRIYEGKTFAVIAEELGIPLGTALARMRAALEKLRRRLSRDDREAAEP